MLNSVQIIGNLGADPEVRYTANGTAVANLSVATSEIYSRDGERQERTEWHRVVAWGKTAENIGKYMSKGRQIFVEGRLQTRKWTDKDGQDRYSTEISAKNVKFLGSAPQGDAQANQKVAAQAKSVEDMEQSLVDSDAPF